MSARGILYGVGVGPGDSELLTLKAVRIIGESDVIAYAAPLQNEGDGESMARSIAAPHIGSGKCEYAIRIPMLAQHKFPIKAVYDEAARDLSVHLEAGRQVAVLCEGDPLFYGSFMYLFALLRDSFDCRIVAGVSSPMAASAAAGFAMAAKDDVLAILPAPLASADLQRQLERVESAVIIKLGRHFRRVGALLDSLGYLADAVYVSHASHAVEQVLPLSEAIRQDIRAPYFSLILWRHERSSARLLW